MATIKAYSDLQQSKKLAEILPLESADMSWVSNGLGKPFARTIPIKGDPEELCACWSLASLLSVLPRMEYLKPFIDLGPKLDSDEVAIYYHSEDSPYIVRDSLIDACYEMIIKLHELNLL